MQSKICFIDFETTGIDVFKDNPIEFGAVLIDCEGRVEKEFHSYISPRTKRKFSKKSQEIHGLEYKQLLKEDSQKEVLMSFFNEFGTNYRFGGWNINFDVAFFRNMCHHSNMMGDLNKINHRHIDVQTIAYLAVELGVVNSKTRSLSDISNELSIERSNYHSAFEDALITSKVFNEIMLLFKSRLV